MIFDSVRRVCSCLSHKFALSRAMHWVKVLRRCANNPASQREYLHAAIKMRHWLKKCGLSVREFKKVSYKRWGYVPNIMRILIKARSLK